MSILIIGTGVIGSVYGWQLSCENYDVIHYVRHEKIEVLRENGIIINCIDMRIEGGKQIAEKYKPGLVDSIEPEKYDLIIIPVKANQLHSIVKVISESKYTGNVLFLQNLWIDDFNFIESTFNVKNIVYGQPHITGGGIFNGKVECTIFRNRNAPTMLGTKNGTITEAVKKVSVIIESAKMYPKVVKNIRPWMLTHYAESVGLLAGVMRAGNGEKYVKDIETIRTSILLTREGFKVCRKFGVHPLFVYPQCLYYAPLNMIASALQKMFSSKESQLMIKGHISHSPDEMKKMFDDIYKTGKKSGIMMKNYQRYEKYVHEFTGVS